MHPCPLRLGVPNMVCFHCYLLFLLVPQGNGQLGTRGGQHITPRNEGCGRELKVYTEENRAPQVPFLCFLAKLHTRLHLRLLIVNYAGSQRLSCDIQHMPSTCGSPAFHHVKQLPDGSLTTHLVTGGKRRCMRM